MDGRQKQRVFNAIKNPLVCAASTSAWLLFILIIFFAVGGHKGNRIIHFGPSELLVFFTIQINTWARWFWLMVFVIADAIVAAWSYNIMTPWLNTDIYTDESIEPTLDYTHLTTLIISAAYQGWASARQFLPFYLAFTQIDVLTVRVVAEVAVSIVTTWTAIRRKSPPSHAVLNTNRQYVGFGSDSPPPSDGFMASARTFLEQRFGTARQDADNSVGADLSVDLPR